MLKLILQSSEPFNLRGQSTMSSMSQDIKSGLLENRRYWSSPNQLSKFDALQNTIEVLIYITLIQLPPTEQTVLPTTQTECIHYVFLDSSLLNDETSASGDKRLKVNTLNT